jgi:hypothetical protein
VKQSFRLSASNFSLLVQRKVTKRKHLSREIKSAQAACGVVAIFAADIHVRSENGRHPCRPPSGCPDGGRMRGVGNVKGLVEPSAAGAGGAWRSAFQLLTFLLRQQPPTIGNPGGVAAMDGRRFRIEPWMASPKIPSPLRLLERLVEEGAFFAYFLCTSKESRSPSGESSLLFL